MLIQPFYHCVNGWLVGRTDFRHRQLGRTLNRIRPVVQRTGAWEVGPLKHWNKSSNDSQAWYAGSEWEELRLSKRRVHMSINTKKKLKSYIQKNINNSNETFCLKKLLDSPPPIKKIIIRRCLKIWSKECCIDRDWGRLLYSEVHWVDVHLRE